MTTSKNIKEDEINWYKKKCEKINEYKNWPEIFPIYLHAAHCLYEELIKKANLSPEGNILELCCGTGAFSFRIADITKAFVKSVDISKESIEICKKNLACHPNPKLSFEVADVEKLSFPDNSFDMICMSGSLSYLDLNLFLKNICRWLKPNGYLIIVDTYGHNPIFNLKRRLNYLFKKTTLQTVLGIPKKETIESICKCFFKSNTYFFGACSFVGPFLKYVIGNKLTAKFVNKCDVWFPFLKKYAFKFVLCAQSPKK